MKLAEQEIVDWYDGLVQAIVRESGTRLWLYCSLVAWDLQSDRKLFALLPLDEDWSRKLLGVLRSEASEPEVVWDRFQELKDRLLESFEGHVELILGESIEDVHSRRLLPIDEVRRHIGRDVEACIEPRHAMKWISRLSP